MKILYLSYDGLTDPLGQSQVIPYCRGLADKGYEIHIVSCEKKVNFSLKRMEIQLLLSESNIKWYPLVLRHKKITKKIKYFTP